MESKFDAAVREVPALRLAYILLCFWPFLILAAIAVGYELGKCGAGLTR